MNDFSIDNHKMAPDLSGLHMQFYNMLSCNNSQLQTLLKTP